MSPFFCVKCGNTSATPLTQGLCSTCYSLNGPAPVVKPDPPATDSAPVTVTLGRDTAPYDPRNDTPDFTLGAPAPGDPTERYTLLEPIGDGGMGCVYRAVQVSTGQIVAIKKLRVGGLSPVAYDRFVTEARALAALNHPHLVRVYDFDPNPRDPQLVMELIDGAPLSRSIGDKPLDADATARLIAQAARGVHAAHVGGVIHRDLKPQNLLLTVDGAIKVADFGLAKRTDEDDGNTESGELAGGTPGFMAPEQVDPEAGECDARTDVWGLGATLYAALVGKPPFPTGRKNWNRVLTDPLVPPRSANRTVPRVMDAIVCKCLEMDPAERYQSAEEVADELDRFRRGESTVAQPLAWHERAWQRLRHTPRATFALAVAAVLLVVLTVAIVFFILPPVSPLAQQQANLRAGREVVLVDDGKFLLEPSWLLGDAVLNAPTQQEPFASFASRDKVMLVVMPDPGVDRYRITAKVKQLPVTPEVAAAVANRIGQVGVFWAFRQTEFRDGVKAKAHMALAYNDFQPNPEKPRPSYLAFWDMGQVEDPANKLAPSIPTTRMGANGKLEFVAGLPGPSRTLVIDVTPDQIGIDFPDGRKTLGAIQLADQCARLERDLRESCNGRPLNTEAWSPRSPVGVFVDRARIAIERFVITPLPPE